MHIPTFQDVIQPYLKYPKVIQTAIMRVETHPSFNALTKSGKKVLQQLITRTSKSNSSEPIRARLDVIADEAKISYKTVQRAMTVLREIGWVTLVSNERAQFGEFRSNQYRLSADLCRLVRLETKEVGSCETERTQMSDGSYIDFIDLSFKEDYREISEKNKNTKPISLPAELSEIVNLGIKDTGVAKLRGNAFEMGYKLEDIWKVAKEYVQKGNLKEGRLYRYLSRMITTPSDYASRASQVGRMTQSSINKNLVSRWWESASGIKLKGEELGIKFSPNEHFPAFKSRVLQKAGYGKWSEVERGSLVISAITPQKTNIESSLVSRSSIANIRGLLKGKGMS